MPDQDSGLNRERLVGELEKASAAGDDALHVKLERLAIEVDDGTCVGISVSMRIRKLLGKRKTGALKRSGIRPELRGRIPSEVQNHRAMRRPRWEGEIRSRARPGSSHRIHLR